MEILFRAVEFTRRKLQLNRFKTESGRHIALVPIIPPTNPNYYARYLNTFTSEELRYSTRYSQIWYRRGLMLLGVGIVLTAPVVAKAAGLIEGRLEEALQIVLLSAGMATGGTGLITFLRFNSIYMRASSTLLERQRMEQR